jgi:hypothetical protein
VRVFCGAIIANADGWPLAYFMGHSRIGTLPATKKWKEVVSLVSNGADAAQIADAVMIASSKTFARVRDDVGFREAMRLILQMSLAGSRTNTAAELETSGLSISQNTSLADVVSAVSEEFDKRVEAANGRSDFSEVAHRALIGSVTELLKEHLPTLFAPARDDVAGAFKKLKHPGNFGKFFQSFAGGLTNELLKSYLSRTLGTHLGEGQRFATTDQIGQFEKAMKTHCHEAAKIVDKFAADWFSKNRFTGAGDISNVKSEAFGWVAFRKLTLELAARARKHGN